MLSFNHLEQNNFTKSKLFKFNWLKGEHDKKIEWQDRLWFEGKELDGLWFEGKELDGLWFEGNECYYNKSRGDVSWVMSWWNLSVMKSITEQRDDQDPNL